jgi:hypothetical protein
MSDAPPGEHLCLAHQGNTSHYDKCNCTICKLEARCALLEKTQAVCCCGGLVKDHTQNDNHSPVEPKCVFEVERDAVKKELKHVQFLLAHLAANFDRLETENKALKAALRDLIKAYDNLYPGGIMDNALRGYIEASRALAGKP